MFHSPKKKKGASVGIFVCSQTLPFSCFCRHSELLLAAHQEHLITMTDNGLDWNQSRKATVYKPIPG